MPSSMAREKRHTLAGQGSKHYGIRRASEGRGHARFSHVFQTFHFVQAATSNNGNVGTWFCWHGLDPCRLYLRIVHKSFNKREDTPGDRLNGLVRVYLDPRQTGFFSEPRHLPFRKMTGVPLQSSHRFGE